MRNFIMSFLLLSLGAALLMQGCQSSSTNPKEDGIKVLVVSNFSNGNAWIDTNFTENMEGITIVTLDVEDDTVRAEELQDIDVVLLYEDGTFGNSTTVGNMIYQYVMAGGNLVIGTFYWQDRSGYTWSGDWGDLEMIDPLYGGSCRYSTDSLGTTLSHPLTNGVNSLKTYYRGGPNTLRDNATAVAWWSNEDVLIAFNKPAGTITVVTAYPAEDYYWESRGNPDAVEGDYFKLWENALKWTAAQAPVTPTVRKDESNQQIDFSPLSKKTNQPSGGAREF